MTHVSYTDLRQNLARYMDEAAENRVPIVVSRQAGKAPVVLMSLAEFESWQETVHLLSSPRNAGRLLAAIRDTDAGHVESHALVPADPAR